MMNEWISVKDRLPEDGELVLVIADGEYENTKLVGAYQLADYSEGEGFILSEFPFAENITVSHWMPLPEPPKGE